MTHGKNTRIIIGGYDLQVIGYSAKQQFSKDLAEADTFGDKDHKFEAGIKGGVFTLDSRFKGDTEETQALLEDMQDNILDNPEVVFGPAGLAAGAQVFISDSLHNSCEVSSDTKSVISVSCMFTANNGVREGVLLVSPYA